MMIPRRRRLAGSKEQVMAAVWQWLILVGLLGGFGYWAVRYYRGQSMQYAAGKRNADTDVFQGKGGCCH